MVWHISRLSIVGLICISPSTFFTPHPIRVLQVTLTTLFRLLRFVNCFQQRLQHAHDKHDKHHGYEWWWTDERRQIVTAAAAVPDSYYLKSDVLFAGWRKTDGLTGYNAIMDIIGSLRWHVGTVLKLLPRWWQSHRVWALCVVWPS